MLQSLARLVLSGALLLASVRAWGYRPRPSLCTGSNMAFDSSTFNFTLVDTLDAEFFPGFRTLEGPTWYKGELYMSLIGNRVGDGNDPPVAHIVRLNSDNEIVPHLNDTAINGMIRTRFGWVIAAIFGRANDPGSISFFNLETGDVLYDIATQFNGLPFNSVNDVDMKRDFSNPVVYFTDPDWHSARPRPQEEESSYYIRCGEDDPTPFGTGVVDKPNGILLSADESKIYVAGRNGLFTFPVNDDGTVVDEATQLHAETLDRLDGMVRDCTGNVYVTLPAAGGVVVLDGETDEIIAEADVPFATNIVFGGDDLTTLYVTTRTVDRALYALNSPVSGENFGLD